jgi:hypothetical protein
MTKEKLKIANDLIDKIRVLDRDIDTYQDYLKRGYRFELKIKFIIEEKIGTRKKDVDLSIDRDSNFCKSFIVEKLNIAIGERHHLKTEFDNL